MTLTSGSSPGKVQTVRTSLTRQREVQRVSTSGTPSDGASGNYFRLQLAGADMTDFSSQIWFNADESTVLNALEQVSSESLIHPSFIPD